jgi:Ca-activated chloride channel homolog
MPEVNDMTYLFTIGIRRAMTVALILAVSVLSNTAHLQTEQEASTPTSPMVRLSVLVLDDSNRAVNDVTQNEFRVFEDDVEQKISFFSTEPLPLSYGLLVDNSGSLRSQIGHVIEAGKRIVNANRPEDEAFLMRFVSSDKIDIIQDFTSSKSALDRSLDQLYPGGGETALIDAVFVAALHMAKAKKDDNENVRRRALILVSDGEERSSTGNVEELFDYLRKNDIQIYVIGLVSELENDRFSTVGRNTKRGKSVDLLNRLAKETGGQAFYPKSRDTFSDVFGDIMRDLRTQCVIGYNPLPNPKSKAFRDIKVKIERQKGAEKRSVITRPGYLVPSK